MPLNAGSRLGPYEIVAPLGAGGMGEVYRARDPRGASPADSISAVLNDPPSVLVFSPGTPPGLADVARRCLEKDANQRFQSARELAVALESISEVRSGSVAPSVSTKPTSMAVLPFSNLSADPDNAYFSDGLAEELINALTRVSPRCSSGCRGHDARSPAYSDRNA